jgi:hypothetical protein
MIIKKVMIEKKDNQKTIIENKISRWSDFGVWRRFGNSKKIKSVIKHCILYIGVHELFY